MLPVTEGKVRVLRAGECACAGAGTEGAAGQDALDYTRGGRRVHAKDLLLRQAVEGKAHLLFDGAMGTQLQASGLLKAGDVPELLNLTHPDDITRVHRSYVEAGAQVVTANTFGANARKLDGAAGVAEVCAAGVACAKASGARYVAADIGPTGALLQPLGPLSFEEAYELFREQVKADTAAGADLFVVETMTDLLEAKAAVLAVKENSDLPVFATMTFDETGRTFLGTSPEAAALTLDALGVDVLGVNCSLGPKALRPLVKGMLDVASCPVMVQANAGLPHDEGGATVYPVGPADYASAVADMLDDGVGVVGGCCGTTPEHIRRLAALLKGRSPKPRPAQRLCAVASAQRVLVLRGHDVGVIGERINPTGKPAMKRALREGDWDHVVDEAIVQERSGADALDVNVGLPELDEAKTLREAVLQVQGASPLPLQVDSSDARAVESAVRVYSGKPLVNSVNGRKESMEAVLPVVAHYGCAVVALALDERGVPKTAQERFEIARRIVEEAERYGVPRTDVYVDCLVMAASTDQRQPWEVLSAVRMVKERLGVRTVLGASNVSFGLPSRPLVNATFLAAAFAAGLDLPITNPLSKPCMDVVDAWRALSGQDEHAEAFIDKHANDQAQAVGAGQAAGGAGSGGGTGGPGAGASASTGSHAQGAGTTSAADPSSSKGAPASSDADLSLHDMVVQGRKQGAAAKTQALLEDEDAMDVINGQLIPALNEVGDAFGRGVLFLPQLMASAEVAKAAFDVIRARSDAAQAVKGPIVLATVKGDVHDIGKNIVRMLLENYGYKVDDLGRDVDPQAVVDAVRRDDARLVGLSALMTTSVRSMEDTVALLRKECPRAKVMVGGAVITPEYARMVGADFYAKDAAASATIAEEVFDG